VQSVGDEDEAERIDEIARTYTAREAVDTALTRWYFMNSPCHHEPKMKMRARLKGSDDWFHYKARGVLKITWNLEAY